MLVGKLTGTGSLKGTLSGTGSLRGTLSGGGVGHGIPACGEPGQGLIKVSDADYDVKWMSILPEDTASGSVASFPDGADDLPMGVVVDIDPVQEGSGDPSPDNIRPISGRTGAKVTRTGRNILPTLSAENVIKYNGYGLTVANVSGGITVTGQSSGTSHSVGFLFGKVDKYIGKPLTISCKMASVGGLPRIMILLCDENFQNRSSIQYFDATGSKTVTFSSGNEGKYIGIALFSTTGSDSTSIVSAYTEIQLELGSTAHAYEPYTAVTHEIPFSTSVYGGKLNVETGELVIDKGRKAFDGTEGWFNNGIRGVALSLSSISPPMNAHVVPSVYTFIFDEYKAITAGQAPQDNGCVNLNSNRTAIQIHDERGMTAASYKTFLNGHNITMVYALATPITLTLDPVEIRSLLGDNNMWADTGNTTVTYKADVQKYIDKKISAAVAAMS